MKNKSKDTFALTKVEIVFFAYTSVSQIGQGKHSRKKKKKKKSGIKVQKSERFMRLAFT